MVIKVGRSDVKPVSMTQVRPQLTEIVDSARDRGLTTALTEYGRPRAIVVPVRYFESAERNAELAERLRTANPDLFATLSEGLEEISVPLMMKSP